MCGRRKGVRAAAEGGVRRRRSTYFGDIRWGGGGGAGGMQASLSRTPPGTHMHGCMLDTSSQAIRRKRQSGKDSASV